MTSAKQPTHNAGAIGQDPSDGSPASQAHATGDEPWALPPEAIEQAPDKPSKSAKKRQMHALQEMGQTLAGLPESRLQALPVSESLREAIAQYQRIRPGARGGRRRQLQLIGKLMREEDTESIQAVLESERQAHRAVSHEHQRVEQCRAQLLSGNDALESFIAEHRLDNEFRTLARQARREKDAGRAPHAQRALFRKLQQLLSESDN